MFNQYPYLNLNDLNLDYILKAIKEMRYEVTNFVSINAIKYADPIQWNITSQYEKNTIVIDPVTGTAYISVASVPAGVALTRPEYWTVVFDLQSFVTKANQNLANNYEEQTTTTATMNTSAGEWVIWGDVLYKALVNITAGDAYVVGSNIERITIEDVINAIILDIANEVQARRDADTTLQNNIDAEAQARQDADTALSDRIAGEVQARTDADTTLQRAIDDEVQARQNADNELRNLILSTSSYYDTIADFKADADIVADKNCVVNGYHVSGDCSIMIWNTTESATGVFGEIQLDNGLYAHLLKVDEKYYDVKQYGAYGDGVHDDYNVINSVLADAKTHDNSLVYFPSGEYVISTYLQAIRHETIQGVYEDLRGLTIKGEGENTLIHGKSSTDTFDVIQLNEVCNVTIKDISITETTTAGSTWGANGISITNGCHDVYIEGVTVRDLPYYVGGGYVDGGKAYTIQSADSASLDMYNISIKNCKSYNVPYGFESDFPANSLKAFNIIVDSNMFECLRCGAAVSLPSAGSGVYTSTLDMLITNNIIRTRQYGVILSRAAGVRVTNNIIWQFDTPLAILPSDANVYGIDVYCCADIYISDCTLAATSGESAIAVRNDGLTISRAKISNCTAMNSYSSAMIESIGTIANMLYITACNNRGAATSYNSKALADANLITDYGGYLKLGDDLMSTKVSAHTFTTGTGKGIPVYDQQGSSLGYIQLFS